MNTLPALGFEVSTMAQIPHPPSYPQPSLYHLLDLHVTGNSHPGKCWGLAFPPEHSLCSRLAMETGGWWWRMINGMFVTCMFLWIFMENITALKKVNSDRTGVLNPRTTCWIVSKFTTGVGEWLTTISEATCLTISLSNLSVAQLLLKRCSISGNLLIYFLQIAM